MKFPQWHAFSFLAIPCSSKLFARVFVQAQVNSMTTSWIGESKMLYSMGLLQPEMVSQEYRRNLLAVSGWDRMFSEAKVFSSDITVYFLGRSTSKSVFGMHTILSWVNAMHCWWRHTVSIVRKDGALVNLSGCRVRNWLQNPRPPATGLQWAAVALCSVSGKQVDDRQLTLNAFGGLCRRLFAFWHTHYAC